MKLNLSDPIQRKLAIMLLGTILKLAGQLVPSKDDVKDVGDNLLNKMEGHYPEGSWQDEAAETVAGSVRTIADIPDSDPSN